MSESLRCEHCGGNLYIEAFKAPLSPLEFEIVCLQCRRQYGGQTARWFPSDLEQLGVSRYDIASIAKGKRMFCWRPRWVTPIPYVPRKEKVA
jgi:hypothetical protein